MHFLPRTYGYTAPEVTPEAIVIGGEVGIGLPHRESVGNVVPSVETLKDPVQFPLPPQAKVRPDGLSAAELDLVDDWDYYSTG